MRDFFSDTVGMELKTLGVLHIAMILIMVIVSYLIYHYRVPLKKFKYERELRYSLATFALLFEFALYGWTIGNGIWDWKTSLPIGVCGITLYLAIAAMYTKKFIIFEIGFFWSFGAVLSVMFPDILYSVDRFRFYQFMFGHMFFFFMYIYMLFVLDFVPDFKSFKRSYIALFVTAVILYFLNKILGTNYFYLVESDGTPFEMFEGYGEALYLIGVYFLISLLISIWYLPFYVYHKKTRVKETK